MKNKKPKVQKKKRTLYELFFKRFFDIIISLLAIIILSPIFLIVLVAEWITLKGRAIFCQYRPGRNGKIFKLYKFRSMTNAVDSEGNLLPDSKRITKFGKFIRKTSLDELPQLFNILKGDMSLIGPRPRLVKDMIFYDEDVIANYSVRPGLTGLSQVSGGRSHASWEEIFEKDIEYAKHVTFFGDIKIFFLTFAALFKSDANTDGKSERDYYYSNYLLRTEKITKEQYDRGLELAQEIIDKKGVIKYQASLQKKEEPEQELANDAEAESADPKQSETEDAVSGEKMEEKNTQLTEDDPNGAVEQAKNADD